MADDEHAQRHSGTLPRGGADGCQHTRRDHLPAADWAGLLVQHRTGRTQNAANGHCNAMGGFDIRVVSTGTVYMDEFYIVAKQEEGPEMDYTDAVVYYNFDDGIAPFEQLAGTTGITAHTTEAEFECEFIPSTS